MDISGTRPASVGLGLSRFALVGGLGFIVDATLLTLLVNGLGHGHYTSRAVSFAVAVSITWLANRRWTFQPSRRRGREYAGYLVVQILGAIINLSIYVVVIELIPRLARVPVIPLACGAAVALVFNFLAARRFVFAGLRGEPASPNPAGARRAADFTYSGVENLEAMAHARHYNNYLVALLRAYIKGPTALDFGAGAGTFAKPVSNPALTVKCLEPDNGLRAQLDAAGFETFGSIEEVPLGSVDSIFSLNVLEHVEDDRGMLGELYTRLKDSGRIILYVPAFGVLYSAMDRRVGHFRRYRRPDLVEKLQAAGFQVRRARYVDSLGFLITLLYKLVGDSSGLVSASSVRLYDRFIFPLSRLLDVVVAGSFGKNLLVVAER